VRFIHITVLLTAAISAIVVRGTIDLFRELTTSSRKVYAEGRQKKNISIRKRAGNMIRKPTKKQLQEINESFEDIDVVHIETSVGTIALISLEEMPVMRMKDFLLTPGDQKMPVLMDIMELCVSTEDRNKISSMSVKEVNRILKKWMDLSSRPSAQDILDELADDEYEEDEE
jgi:hypothetical protein